MQETPFFMSQADIAFRMISECGLSQEDLEFSPLDGRQYMLFDIAYCLLYHWTGSNVFNWLMCVYQSYERI